MGDFPELSWKNACKSAFLVYSNRTGKVPEKAKQTKNMAFDGKRRKAKEP